MATQEELRQSITNSIIEALTSGDLPPPWERPWGISPNSGFPTNVVSSRKYSGVNVLLLRLAAMTHQFTSKYSGDLQPVAGHGRSRPENDRTMSSRDIGAVHRVLHEDHEDRSGPRQQARKTEVVPAPSRPTACSMSIRWRATTWTTCGVKEESLNVNPAFVDYEPAEETIKGTGADIRLRWGSTPSTIAETTIILCPPEHRFKEEKDYYSTIFHEFARLDRP